MADYTIRVVLHAASREQYDTLHERMERRAGAIRQICGNSGIWFDLPDGEYSAASGLDVVEIRDLVYSIATSVKPIPDPSVLITESGARAWRLMPIPGES